MNHVMNFIQLLQSGGSTQAIDILLVILNILDRSVWDYVNGIPGHYARTSNNLGRLSGGYMRLCRVIRILQAHGAYGYTNLSTVERGSLAPPKIHKC